jgi:cytochrome c oxidase subunit IV
MDAADHKAPNYIAIWGMLAVLTMVEVAVVYIGIPHRLMVISLVFLALWKALLVALYFMHLRFEPKRLLYIVLAPFPLAVILVFAVIHGFRGP